MNFHKEVLRQEIRDSCVHIPIDLEWIEMDKYYRIKIKNQKIDVYVNFPKKDFDDRKKIKTWIEKLRKYLDKFSHLK